MSKAVLGMARRLGFVKLALKDQQTVSRLCGMFGLSRKTGYKWKKRFEEEGIRGLYERKRRPHTSPNQTSDKWLIRIRRLRRSRPSWGSRKLRVGLRRKYPGEGAPTART